MPSPNWSPNFNGFVSPEKKPAVLFRKGPVCGGVRVDSIRSTRASFVLNNGAPGWHLPRPSVVVELPAWSGWNRTNNDA
jgi:hypothetical protein